MPLGASPEISRILTIVYEGLGFWDPKPLNPSRECHTMCIKGRLLTCVSLAAGNEVQGIRMAPIAVRHGPWAESPGA